MLRIEITDSSCEEGHAYVHTVSIETNKEDIMAAIRVFYPEAYEIHMWIEEDSDESGE